MIENVSTQLTVFHCFAHCLLPGRAFASLYALLFLEKEAEIGGRDIAGLENSTRPLVFTGASDCRASENFDISSENHFFPSFCNCRASAYFQIFRGLYWQKITMFQSNVFSSVCIDEYYFDTVSIFNNYFKN